MATITGTSLDDTISGTAVSAGVLGGVAGLGADSIAGFAGNDWLDGAAGNDTLDGGEGNDTLVGGAGADSLIGGSGYDVADYSSAGAGVVCQGNVFYYQFSGGYDGLNFQDGQNGNDTVRDVEAIVGSNFADIISASGFPPLATPIALFGAGGDDALTGAARNDTLDGGAGNDTLDGGAGNDTLVGGAGIDMLRFDSSNLYGSTGVKVDLLAGTATAPVSGSTVPGATETDTLSGIENVTGTLGSDLILGDSGANLLLGGSGAGNDTLSGGGGNDTLGSDGYGSDSLSGDGGDDTLSGGAGNDAMSGGEGNDTLSGAYGYDTLSGDAGNDMLSGGYGNDTLSGGAGNDMLNGDYDSDVLSGDEGNDTLTGGYGNDTLSGGAGNDMLNGDYDSDVLSGGLGDDTLDGGVSSYNDADLLDGGDGRDLLRFGVDTVAGSSYGNAVTVDLAGGRAFLGNYVGLANTDTISGFEDVLTGAGADSLLGNAAANLLNSGAGGDTLDGGAGSDTLDGGDGFDAIRFAAATAGVNVNLRAGTASDGTGGSDQLLGIEAAFGTGYADTLAGNDLATYFSGGGGNDVLMGSLGSDGLDGGVGFDIADYSGLTAGIRLSGLTGSYATLIGGTSGSGGIYIALSTTPLQVQKSDGSDLLTGIEKVIGTGYNDTMDVSTSSSYYTSSVNFAGGAGNDALTGGGGSDTLDGGAGSDTLDGGAGFDLVSYANWGTGVTVNLATGQGSDGVGADVYRNIEQVTGSAFADRLTGLAKMATSTTTVYNPTNGTYQTVTTNTGGSTLEGLGGADTLDGLGKDWNVISYASSTAAVAVTLGDGTVAGAAKDGWGGVDVLRDVLSVLGATNATNRLTGNASGNALVGGELGDSISGLAGNDTLVGLGGNDTITGGTGRDSLMGGDGDDQLAVGTADKLGDWLSGGAGNDRLVGSNIAFGPDVTGTTLDGGLGADTLLGFSSMANTATYAGREAAVVVDLLAGTAQLGSGPGAEVDKLDGIRSVRGTSYGDVFTGSDANEAFAPGDGADQVTGGGGVDRVSYAQALAAVTVDLANGIAVDGAGDNDTLSGIEDATGSNFNDSLLGDAKDNTFRPLAGNDFVNGADGEDWVNYSAFQTGTGGITGRPENGMPYAGVTVNLALGMAKDSWGGTDDLVSIEHAAGTMNADILTGAIRTGQAASYLRGFGGNDLLRAERANTGATADYQEDISGVRVNLSEDDAIMGGVTLAGATAQDGWGGMDILINIQRVKGSGYADTLLGSALNDRLAAGYGNDSLAGGDGNDALYGEYGDDTLIGGLGADSLSGGAGIDQFIFQTNGDTGLGTSRDVISDFAAGTGERINLVGMDANLAVTGDQAFSFIGGAAFTGLGQLRFANGILEGNTTGDSLADFQIVLTGVKALTGADLLL